MWQAGDGACEAELRGRGFPSRSLGTRTSNKPGYWLIAPRIPVLFPFVVLAGLGLVGGRPVQADQPAKDMVAAAHGLAEGGPALEEVPALAAPADGVPAAATWPLVRHERRLRLLAVLNLQQSAAPYQRIARRCRAALDLAFTAHAPGGVPDDISTLAHTNDKWIEASKDPTAKEVADHAVRRRQALLATAAGKYDAVFCSDLVPELAGYVRQGGVWVVCGNVYPDAESPLAAIWPAQPMTHHSWHHAGARRGEVPELAGLPLERLSAHCWFPLAVPGDDAEALATGEAGATFVRRVGAGAIVFVPTGPISRTWNAVEQFQRLYDHDEIWLRFWDQLLHALVGGDKALPAVADLRPAANPVPAGTEFASSARIVNLSGEERRLAVAVHVVSPLGRVVFSRPEEELVFAARDQVLGVPRARRRALADGHCMRPT